MKCPYCEHEPTPIYHNGKLTGVSQPFFKLPIKMEEMDDEKQQREVFACAECCKVFISSY